MWGVGSGSYGYGQTPILGQVTTGNSVTAAQWADLITNMELMGDHQGSALTGMTSPVVTDPIAPIATIDGNLTTLWANRNDSIANGAPSQVINSSAGSWTTSSVHTITATWTTPDEMRYFFNGGGQIEVTMSRTGGSVNAKNTEWSNLLTNCGSINMTAFDATKVGGAAPGVGEITNDFGYYDWNVPGLLIHRQFAGGVYSSNSVELVANTNGQNLGGFNDNGNILTFVVTMTDSAGDPPAVDGTTSVTVVARPPATTYIADSWGTPVFGGGTVQT